MNFVPFLLLHFFFFVHGKSVHDDSLKDGACPTPPDPLATFHQSAGEYIWYDVSTNYELAKTPSGERSCIENKATANEDGTVYLETRFTDSNGPNQLLKKRFDPVEGQLGRFDSNIPASDGGYVNHGWRYTVVAEDGDSFMEYACKAFGDKHRDFYRVRSRYVPASEESTKKLQQIASDSGDQREFVKIKHENCQYQLGQN